MNRWTRQWERLGASDPYWAVLTEPTKKGGGWQQEEFFATGEHEIRSLMEELQGRGIALARHTALDFGCGVGRLTRALSNRFSRVVGVDISSTMLQEARSTNAHLANVEFLQIDGASLAPLADASMDFIYSNITLQHSPRPVQLAAITEFLRVLKPGGVAVFHTPSVETRSLKGLVHRMLPNPVLNIVRRLKYGPAGVMEVHTLQEALVRMIIQQRGGQLLHVDRSLSAGDTFLACRYTVSMSLSSLPETCTPRCP